MKTLENLKWRYATKKFDNTKKVSNEDLEKLKEAISLSATSYGLEAYKVIIVESQELRPKLQEASWGQSQIADASHIVVFCNYTEVSSDYIDSYLKLKSDTQGIPLENLEGYGGFMKNTIGSFPAEAVTFWTAKQTYIALANLMSAAAELKIDSCPMEGFEADKYNEILGLKEKGLNASVIATIGYRSEEDQTQHGKKSKKTNQ